MSEPLTRAQVIALVKNWIHGDDKRDLLAHDAALRQELAEVILRREETVAMCEQLRQELAARKQEGEQA